MSLPFSRIHALKSIILPRPSIRNLILRKEKGNEIHFWRQDLDCLRTNLWKGVGGSSNCMQPLSTLPTKSMEYRQRSSAGYCGLKRISVFLRGFHQILWAQFLPLIGWRRSTFALCPVRSYRNISQDGRSLRYTN